MIMNCLYMAVGVYMIGAAGLLPFVAWLLHKAWKDYHAEILVREQIRKELDKERADKRFIRAERDLLQQRLDRIVTAVISQEDKHASA